MPYNSDGIGYQNQDTSQAAADAISAKAPNLRSLVRRALKNSPTPLTADEIAQQIGKHFISVRPRLTELADEGVICDSGIRREGPFGRPQIAWKYVRAEA